MQIARSIAEIESGLESVVAVGSFDGLHRGHQMIVSQTVAHAKELKCRSILLTFDPHPREVVGTPVGQFELLTTHEERIVLCEELGIDILLILPFNRQLSEMSAEEFYETYLFRELNARVIIVGYDHHVGKDRQGSTELLTNYAKQRNASVIVVEKVLVHDLTVNSTAVRLALKAGDVEKTEQLLGRPYTLSGIVAAGDRRGRTLGFPTANIELLSSKKLVPANGIYFTRVRVKNAEYYGMTSIGVRPTFFLSGRRTIEVNILNFDADIYGERLELTFLRRLRDELRFSSKEELVKQMYQDKEQSLILMEQFENKTK